MARRDMAKSARLSLEIAPALEEPGAAEAALYLDRAGLERLRSALDLIATGESDQAHLFSCRWGGEQLSEERWRAGGLITRHLRICLRPDGEPLREVRYRADP